jgi:hypothetical protein
MGIERPNVWEKGYRAVQRKGNEMVGVGHYFSGFSIDMKTNTHNQNSWLIIQLVWKFRSLSFCHGVQCYFLHFFLMISIEANLHAQSMYEVYFQFTNGRQYFTIRYYHSKYVSLLCQHFISIMVFVFICFSIIDLISSAYERKSWALLLSVKTSTCLIISYSGSLHCALSNNFTSSRSPI